MSFPTLGTFPVSAGWPQRHGVEIATLWSKQLAAKFWPLTILSSISTSKYEGEIKNQGDNLIIRKEADIEIHELVEGQPLRYQNPTSDTITLTVDQADYWGIKEGDIERSMMDLDWTPKWMSTAATKLKIRVDRKVLAWMPAQVHAYNQGIVAGKESASINMGAAGAPVEVTKLNSVDVIAECEQVLDEQDVPDEGRYIIIPPPMKTRIVTSELKDASLTGDAQSPLRNGLVGDILKFKCYKSNLLSHAQDSVAGVDAWNVLFGWSEALAFAQTVTNTETLRSAEFFGNLIRGMQVYGYKVTNAEALGNLYCNFAGTAVAS